MAKIENLQIGVTFTPCDQCDRVEVVRCKDCKHLENGNRCRVPLGMGLGDDQEYIFVDQNDFCSCGERRE